MCVVCRPLLPLASAAVPAEFLGEFLESLPGLCVRVCVRECVCVFFSLAKFFQHVENRKVIVLFCFFVSFLPPVCTILFFGVNACSLWN